MKEVTIPEDGMMAITLRGFRREIDLYETFCKLSDMHAKVATDLATESEARKEQEYNVRVCDFLVALGYPQVTHKEAMAFDAAVIAAVDELGKAPAAPPTPA